MNNNVDNYNYDELKQMEKDYDRGKWIPCNIDEVDKRVSEINKLGF